MKSTLKQLLHPRGVYSTRRLIAIVGVSLTAFVTIAYLVVPNRYKEVVAVITALSAMTAIGTGATAFNKHDKTKDSL